MAGSEASPGSKVKFQDDTGERTTLIKHVPTQKYNRKEIQKRLEIESWMEAQLKDLFQSDVCLFVCVVRMFVWDRDR